MRHLIIALILSSCSLGQINRSTTFEKDLFNEETLLRFNSVAIKELSKSTDIKLASLAKCHQGDSKEALKDLKDVYQNYKNNAIYWNVVGTCYYLNEENAKASFYFQHALGLKKTTNSLKAYSFNNLGVILLKQRHYDQAFEMFSKSHKLNSNLVTPRFNLAQLHIQFGQIEEASRILNSLFEKNPEDIDVLSSLAVIALIDKKYQKAISIYERIGEEEMERSDIAGFYALALYKNGQFKKAKVVLEQQNVSTEKAFYQLNRELASLIKTAIKNSESGERKFHHGKL